MARKKQRAKFRPIKIKKPAELTGNYNNFNALKELSTRLAEISAEVDYELKQQEELFNSGLVKRLVTSGLGEILDKEFSSPERLILKLSLFFKKQIKKQAMEQAVNDAYQQVNRGEVMAAESSNVNTLKRWVTQFDSKVSSWHSAVNHQHRRLNQNFTVPHPKGVDQLKAPKIPPISVENFINCRCFVEYEVD